MANVLIAGASRGIGIEIFKNFIGNHEVEKVVAISRSFNSENIKEISNSKKIEWYLCDFSSKEGIENLNFSKKLPISALIYNAGTMINKLFIDTTDEDWEESFNVNVIGAVKIIKKTLPNLALANGSHIVLVGSMGGFQGSRKFLGLSCYSASKGALSILAESLAEELKDFNISVNCLCLGSVDTDMFKNAFPGNKASMTAKEVGKMIADFALNGHQFFNGKSIPVSHNIP
ncbi:MAG: SDR family oxidoreductase [Cytophagales bacterium]